MADNKDNDAVQPGISDPLSKRDTDTGSLERLDDTRTRKTIKLRPVASGQNPVKLAEAAPKPGPAEEVTDPLNTRHTNTGSFAKLDDTRTRKTIKMAPATMKGEADPEAKTIEIAMPPAAAEAASPEPKTIDLAPQAENMETATVPVSKVAPVAKGAPNLVEGAKAPIPMAAPKPIPMTAPKPIPMAVPKPMGGEDKTIDFSGTAAQTEEKVTTISGKIDSQEDTRTRKTIKITPTQTPKPSVLDATESVMPSVAPAKAISPAEKTIKLRPSEGGSAPPAPTAPVAPQSSAKDTIKLKPSGSAPPMVKPATPPPSGVTPSAATVNLKPATPPPSGSAPAAATVNLKPSSPPSAATVNLKPAAPGAPLKPPTPKPASSSGESAAPPPVSAPPSGAPKLGVKLGTQSAAGAAAAPEEGKKKGLTVKKDEKAADAPAGPPRAQKEQEELKGSKKKNKGDSAPSLFYTITGVFTLLLILFSAFVSAAQYVNLWEQSRFEERVHITVPILEDHINMK